jgi:hypothetical protein
VAHLGLADGGVLVLIPALGSHPRGEREDRVAGRSCERSDRGGVHVRGGARQTRAGLRGRLDGARPVGHPGASHAVARSYIQNFEMIRWRWRLSRPFGDDASRSHLTSEGLGKGATGDGAVCGTDACIHG